MLSVSFLSKWVSVMAATCVPCVCRTEVRLACLLFTPRTLIVSTLSLLIMLVVFFLFPLCVCGVCFIRLLGFMFTVTVGLLAHSVVCVRVLWGFNIFRFCVGVFGSSQKVTCFVLPSLILFSSCGLDSIPLVFSWGLVIVSCLCCVFILGFKLGFRSFWVSVGSHFRAPCRYLRTVSDMLLINVCSRCLSWDSSLCLVGCLLFSGL